VSEVRNSRRQRCRCIGGSIAFAHGASE
jgi:hypothetical protein